MFIPAVQGGHAINDITLDITSNASEVNILTLATAAGYSASDSTGIIVNVASGVTISASSSHAMRTGALNANSNLTINVASGAAITGFTGTTHAAGGCPGANGGDGGDGIFFETNTGGSAVLSVVNNGTVSGGGGGGGSGGRRGGRQNFGQDDTDKSFVCGPDNGPTFFGSNGSNGSAGGLGQAGSAGGSGTFGGGVPSCTVQTACGGGSGGAAGFAVRKSSRTVSILGSGTYNGSTA